MATGCAEPGPIYMCFLFEHQYKNQLIVYLNAIKSFRDFFVLAFIMDSFIYFAYTFFIWMLASQRARHLDHAAPARQLAAPPPRPQRLAAVAAQPKPTQQVRARF